MRLRNVTLVASLAALGISAAPAAAAPSDQAECRQQVRAALIASSEEGTYGDFMSDTIFGNEPNIVGPFSPGGPSEQEPGTKAGRVVPSSSPGPDTVGGGRITGGEVQENIRTFCSS